MDCVYQSKRRENLNYIHINIYTEIVSFILIEVQFKNLMLNICNYSANYIADTV
jgi:hypothetical protein